jgi:TetR/AcrR family acrAB operon transcriptional repressor
LSRSAGDQIHQYYNPSFNNHQNLNWEVGLENDDPLLESASRLIPHYGFDKTTMDDIAREAGVSKGALYLVWSSKDQLFEALLGYDMKRLLDDLQERVERDPQGGTISNQYRHTVIALRTNPLMGALRILGDFVRRQDVERYTRRMMMGADGVRRMLRGDIRPQVITYLFSILALGYMSIGSILPESEAPALEEVGEALAAMMQAGLEAPGGNKAEGKQAFEQMIDLMKKQYGEPFQE